MVNQKKFNKLGKNFLLITLYGGLILMIGVILATRFLNPTNTWLCDGGKWIKLGNPSSPMPTLGCGQQIVVIPPSVDQINGDLIITKPVLNAEVSSTIDIAGQALGSWFFEASFPIKAMTEAGEEIGLCVAQAGRDWMTNELVPFTCQLKLTKLINGKGFLLFKKDNPSGDSVKDASFKYPISFKVGETMGVKTYWLNAESANDCQLVIAAERTVPKSQEPARAALEALLTGPNQEERNTGLRSAINNGVAIKRLVIVSGVAEVDFDKQIQDSVSGSCRVMAIRSQITKTLMQFASVKKVVISVDGNVEEALQP